MTVAETARTPREWHLGTHQAGLLEADFRMLTRLVCHVGAYLKKCIVYRYQEEIPEEEGGEGGGRKEWVE